VLRDRETWMTALCYWVLLSGMLIGVFTSRWLKGFPLIVPVIAVVAAMPASIALAIYERRSEARSARERAHLRAEGRFEEAAEWQKDSFYVGWTTYRIVQAGFAALLTMVGIVLVMPVLVFSGVFLGGWFLWWAYGTSADHRQDIEHRRTSEQRMTAAEDALENSGWNAGRNRPLD
jgi:hypothetical protein